MNIEEFFDERSGKTDYREYCLSLSDKCNPTEAAELKEQYQAIGEPFDGTVISGIG